MAGNHNAGNTLGPLESAVMEIVWRDGDCNVRQVAGRLRQRLAYTTVMTTLDRLFKKGLLERRKQQRAFVYAARVSQAQWLRQRAGEFVADFFGEGAPPERMALLSCLLEAVGEYDAGLLDALEGEIRDKRRQLERSQGK